MAFYKGEYSAEFNEMNRFQNLDGIECKIVSHLLKSDTKQANNIWKILKNDSDVDALSLDKVSLEDRLALVCKNNGQSTDKRVFIQPFVDDAWSEQCSSIYVYVDNIEPTTHLEAVVGVTVEIIVHSKISVINGDGDQILNPDANPNDSNKQGDIVVAWKNRATVLLKSIIAELNGLYLDGIGWLMLSQQKSKDSKVSLNLWNHRSFYGYTIKFVTTMSNVSADPDHSL